MRQEFEQLLEDRRILTDPRLGPFAAKKAEPPVPVNLTRLIGNAKKTFKVNMNAPSMLKPLDIVHKVKELLTKLDVVVGEDNLSKEAQFNATYNFFAMVRSTLSSKKVLSEHRLSPQVSFPHPYPYPYPCPYPYPYPCPYPYPYPYPSPSPQPHPIPNPNPNPHPQPNPNPQPGLRVAHRRDQGPLPAAPRAAW